jgi:hypothetical protein
MKVGVVTSAQIEASGIGDAYRRSLDAKYYLDFCAHCKGQKNNPQHHDDQGRCGRYRRVFVLDGTTFNERAIPPIEESK